ncbi:MAG: hypothetical protein P4M02_01320, partial [Clostridia bacterium]|nr:hypothetical protein [Clostridia bacterium]
MGKIFKKDGYALLWVLCIFTFAVLLSGALLTATAVAAKTTAQQVQSQQAYFTARSAVKAVIAHMKQIASNSDALKAFIKNTQSTGNDTVDHMGTYKVYITQDPDFKDNNQVSVSATATYANTKSTVTAHLKVVLPAPTVVPFNYMFYINSPAVIPINEIDGDVYTNGNLTYQCPSILADGVDGSV